MGLKFKPDSSGLDPRIHVSLLGNPLKLSRGYPDQVRARRKSRGRRAERIHIHNGKEQIELDAYTKLGIKSICRENKTAETAEVRGGGRRRVDG